MPPLSCHGHCLPRLTTTTTLSLSPVLTPRHFQDNNKEDTIDLIHTFRNYLHYHIKCSKAYLHQRMRARTAGLLKVGGENGGKKVSARDTLRSRHARLTVALLSPIRLSPPCSVQILNRARPEVEKEKKTASGRSFLRK